MADLNKQLQADRDDDARARRERDFLIERINYVLDLGLGPKTKQEDDKMMCQRVRNVLSRAIGAVEKGQV